MDISKARQELLMGKTIYDMNLRVADYGRVSTDKEDQLNSLENQVNFFNDLIGSVKNWTHIKSYSDEGISGTQVYKREEFLKMIEDARLGKIDLIITKEVSRFARNTIDSIKYTQELLTYGVIVLFLTDNINTINPDSEFRLTLMASMAQDEVRKLSERVKFGIKRSIKDGKLGGSSLYGYIKKNGKLIINPDEAPIVKKIFELYLTGEYGLKKIGELLSAEGHYTRKGKIFSDITLKKMLTNPRYKGYYTANLSEIENYRTHKKIKKPESEWIVYKDTAGNIPAIIEEEIWNKVNKIYNQRKNTYNKNNLNKESYLKHKTYTSKLICKEHSTPFIRTSSGKRQYNPVWRCNEYLRHGLKGCQTPNLNEKYLNIIFIKIIENILSNPNSLIDQILKDYKNIIEEFNNQEKDLKLKIKEYETTKDKLLDMLLRNIISEKDYQQKNNKLEEAIANIKNKIKNNKENINTKKIINQIKEKTTLSLNIKENIGKYFNLFIDKVYITKINNNRNNLNLNITFKYNKKDITINYNKNNFE